MKQLYNPIKQHAANIFAALLLALLAVNLGGCATDDDFADGTDSDSVVISGINVGISGTVESRNTTDFSATSGFDGIVKKHFVEGDVITLIVNDVQYNVTASGIYPDLKWTITKMENKQLTDIIVSKETLAKGINVTVKFNASFDVNYPIDLLEAKAIINGYGTLPAEGAGIALAQDGSLSIRMEHIQALVRATFEGDLANKVTGVTVDESTPMVSVKGAFECFLGNGATINSFTVTTEAGNITAGENLNISTAEGKLYPFKITLNEGKTDVTFLSDNTLPGWENGDNNFDGPIRISTAADLTKIGADDAYPISGEYILMNDITLTDSWKPISTFTGKFNGNGHSISGMNITTGTGNIGLFAEVNESGIIHNLHIESPTITGLSSTSAGAIAGKNSGRIDYCSVNGGSISNSNSVGGIVGENSGTITRCWATGISITGTNNIIGGLVGTNAENSNIIASYTLGVNLTGSDNNVGGLAGSNSGSIFGCYTKGNYNLIGNSTNTATSSYDKTTTDYSVLVKDSPSIANITSITANSDGNLNEITAVTWTTTGIWGENVSTTVPPTINMNYNGGNQ